MEKINVALVAPPIVGHLNRGTGVYLDNLFSEFAKEKLICATIVKKENSTASYDLVHFPYFDPFFLTLPFQFTKPTIVTIHDLIPLKFSKHFPKGMRGNVKWLLQKHRVKQTRHIITDSNVSKNDIVRILNIDPKVITMIYLAASSDFKKIIHSKKRTVLQKKYKLPDRFALYVGDINWNKNIPGLVKAIREIDVPLVLVSSALRKGNTHISKMLRRDKRFFILPYVDQDELIKLYNLAVVSVFPSFYEGFGLPVLEAMASGCPVVCSREGSLKEVAGDAAQFCDPYNPLDIANAIGQVYFNENVQLKLSQKGLKQARNFSWKKTAEETIAVYKKVLGV